MKKLNLKGVAERLSKEQMKNVTGGNWCGGSCSVYNSYCDFPCRCRLQSYGPARGTCIDPNGF